MRLLKKQDTLWEPTVESSSNSSTIYDRPLQENIYTSSRKSILELLIGLAQIWRTTPLAVVSLFCSVGLLFIGFGFYASRVGNGLAEPIFWAGTAVLLLPVVVAIIAGSLTRTQQVGALLILGLAFYLFKVIYSPSFFTFLDEMQHWRTVNDILLSHHLFDLNPILTVSPYYPGLEIVTDALISLTGLSIFQAGLIIIGVGRIIIVLSLYLLFEKISQSSQVAGIGTLVYMANPHFLLFDAQFAYESLALPLAVLTLYLAVKHADFSGFGKLAMGFVILLGVAAVIVTHHVTSFLLVSILLLWAFILGLKGIQVFARFSPTWAGLLGYAGIVTWLAYVATQAVVYLSSPLITAMQQIVLLILGERTPRQLFVQSNTGLPNDLYLKVLGIASVLLILLLLPYGLLKVWQKYRSQPVAVILGLIAISYPVTMALHYVPWGLLVATRTAPYVFLGVGFVVAVGYTYFRRSKRWSISIQAIFISIIMVVFLGMVASGVSAWGLPVEYNQESYTNSADQQSISAADWAWTNLGPNQRFAAEGNTQWILASYGEQRSITPDADKIWEQSIFDAGVSNGDILGLLRGGQIQYLAIDRRNGSALWNPESNLTQKSIASSYLSSFAPRALYSEFDYMNQVSRIYDGGAVVLYNVGILSNVK
jgi:hypothetical protein